MSAESGTNTGPRQPLNPELPEPPGQDIEAPDIHVDAPEGRETPDSTGVSTSAGTEEAPD
jgi:hypothetical protein